MNLKKKKKEDSDCNFYHFLLLVPYPNNFLVACLCILIFHGVYPPTFYRAKILFSYLVARGWENLKFLVDLLYWGNQYLSWERGLGHSLP